MQQNEIYGQKTDLFEEFMDVTMQLSEEELQAVHGVIPMTQELFNRCAKKCEELGAIRQFESLITDFPEQFRCYQEAQREEEFSDEKLETDEVWKRINSQLEKK